MRTAVQLSIAAAICGLFFCSPVSAESLKISPLRYDTTVLSGEKKKGFVDITNPSAVTADVKLSVQAFRQTNNSGSLEFYDSEALKEAVKLEFTEVELGPRETLHLAFLLDGARLPNGDNFVAIFASTIPEKTSVSTASVRVGTLLFIENDTPSSHKATVDQLSVPFFQFGSGLTAQFAVHNTAKLGEMTGFSPKIAISAWPYVKEEVTGPLVFAGRTRNVTYVKNGNFLGIVAFTAQVGSSEKTAYSIMVTGYWRVLLPTLIVVAGATIWLGWHVRHRRKNRRA